MPRNYGYDAYRGRNGMTRFFTVLAAILLVVLVLAVCAFFFLQRYLVYTDDGQVKLELPFLQPKPEETVTADSQQPTESQEVVVITAPPAPTPSSEPTPAPNEALRAIHAVWLLRAQLTGGTVAQEVAAAGGDAVLLNLKADDGTLGYVSDLSDATRLNSSAAERKLNTAIAALPDTGLYTIARVSCFRDNTAPKWDNALAIRTNSGYNWRDSADIRWMNVAVPAARQYVVGVIRELAAMGFDEILLENSGYPTDGTLEYIKVGEAYDPTALSAPVEQFYQEVRGALEGTGVKLGISTSEAVMTGEGDLSGQTLELLAKYADRVYAPWSETADYAALLQTDSSPLTPDRLVCMVPKGTEFDPSASQLLLR